ncbi:hypothetical protein [Pontibacter saemangeumensis]|uniref:hypothetical protein n=1 Tax=Pontibacter saemangeumensis TaxID=1084525 RepID=UPI0031E6D489
MHYNQAQKNRDTLIDMLTFNQKSTSPCVRYFYLPANPSKQSEVIEVLNSGSDVVQVPMREEDLELTAFFERGLTPREKALYKSSETWKVFSYWEELQHDHLQYGLKDEELRILLSLRNRYSLEDDAAVSA